MTNTRTQAAATARLAFTTDTVQVVRVPDGNTAVWTIHHNGGTGAPIYVAWTLTDAKRVAAGYTR